LKSTKCQSYRVTDHVIADLEKGIRTWMKPWSVAHTAGRITKRPRVTGVHAWKKRDGNLLDARAGLPNRFRLASLIRFAKDLFLHTPT
jgi:hypothetical protein